MVTSGTAVSSATDATSNVTDDSLRGSLVKVAFLFNFARFTDWPARAFQAPMTPLRFCVLGEDPFGAPFDAIANKEVRGRPVTVDRVAAAGDAARCHVLYVSGSENRRLAEILESVRGRPVLTVAEMADFAKSGGIINLKTVDNRIRFEVNLTAARQAGLRFSSRFLNLATIVSN